MNKSVLFVRTIALVFSFLLIGNVKLFAQGKGDTLNSLTIIGVGVFQADIADANKISDNPTVNDSTQKIAVPPFGINSKKINTPFNVEPIAPAQIQGEPLTKLYSGLVKIGFGNYSMPYGEIWYNYLRSKEIAYGVRLKHLSSIAKIDDYGNSSFSDNEVSVYGKKFLKEHTLSGNFDYNRNVVHFYGYDTDLNDLDESQTVQCFNLFKANAELVSHYTKPERYNHDVKLSYYNLSDLYKSSENNINANGYVQTAIMGELLRVNAAVDYYNYKTTEDTTNNTVITLNPNFIADGEKYHASIGATATMDILVHSKFYFYPNLELSYNIFEDIIIPYAGASGGLKKNSFKSLTDANQFVLSNLNTTNTNTKYDLFGGLRGTLSSKIAYSTRVSYSSISNLAMYVNDYEEILKNRFDVIYDNADVLNVRGEVSYQNREKLRIILRGDYFNYKTKTELRAWFKPQVELTLSANYNLKDKIVVKADLFYYDSQYAKTIEKDLASPIGETKVVAKELKGVFDANVGVEYRYTKKLGFFLNFNNIAAQRYNRWYKYPTQKFGIMAGLSFAF